MTSKIVRSFAMALLALVATATTLAAAPVSASAAAAADTSICHDNSYGGDWFCAYGHHSFTFTNGTNQFFVIGPDFAVWTRWRNSSNEYSAWTSLGGTIRSSYSSADFKVVGCGGQPSVLVVGTNNHWYINSRKTTGSWNGWVLGSSVACQG
jgi:hypothetical protein